LYRSHEPAARRSGKPLRRRLRIISGARREAGYFGFADGKAAVRRIYPAGPHGRFGYLELTCRF
jgi:hypothetical protein